MSLPSMPKPEGFRSFLNIDQKPTVAIERTPHESLWIPKIESGFNFPNLHRAFQN